MKVVVRKTEKARVKKVKELILSSGNKIGSVWFKKRSDGSLRKMAYRIKVKTPTYAQTPSGDNFKRRQAHNSEHKLLTVFDVNKVVRARSGKRKGLISGRGQWRSVPLDSVTRVCVNGEIYKIKSS